MLSSSLLQLYAHASPNELPERVFSGLRLLFPEGLISLDEVFTLSGEVVHHIDSRDAHVYHHEIIEAWQTYSHQHPGIGYVADGGKEAILYLTDMMLKQQFKKLDVYQTVFRPLEIRDEITFILPSSASSTLGITICLPKKATSVQRELASILYPHLVQAQHNASLTTRNNLLSASEKIYQVEISLRKGEKVIDWPQRARHLLDLFFPRRINVPWQPPAELISWMRLRRQSFEQGRVDWRRLSPLLVSRNNESLHINLSQGLNSETEVLFLSGRLANPVPLQMTEFPLTPRERQIVFWIVEGKSNSEIAIILSISVPTVKKHLENIFQKLGVESRMALTVMILKSNNQLSRDPLDTSRHDDIDGNAVVR